MAARLFCLSRSAPAQKMCEPYVEVAIRIDSQLTPNLSLLPNLDWRQTNFGSNFSVWEKKIEMDFVTFIGFLATSQVFQADGWFMVLQGGAHVLCGPRDGPPRKHWRVILRGSKYNTTKKEALQSESTWVSRPHRTSQWVKKFLRNCPNCPKETSKKKWLIRQNTQLFLTIVLSKKVNWHISFGVHCVFFFQISFWRKRPNYHFSAPLWRSQRTTKGDTCPKVKLLLGPGQMFYGPPCWSK